MKNERLHCLPGNMQAKKHTLTNPRAYSDTHKLENRRISLLKIKQWVDLYWSINQWVILYRTYVLYSCINQWVALYCMYCICTGVLSSVLPCTACILPTLVANFLAISSYFRSDSASVNLSSLSWFSSLSFSSSFRLLSFSREIRFFTAYIRDTQVIDKLAI
jgi:hypothetical protein